MRHLKDLAVISSLATPLFASAQTVYTVLNTLQAILNQFIPILMVIATIVFLWGVVGYITSGGDEERKKTSTSYIIWGLVGLFVMVAVWGIVRILIVTFGVGGVGIPSSPGAF